MTELETRIHELRLRGMSYSQIQKELNCSKATISYHLGAGQKEKNAARFNKLKNAARLYLQEVKTNSVCADCGENYPYWMMDFDHLGDKEFTISMFARNTVDLEKIKAEIAKCEVVCANCHRDRTHSRMIDDSE